MMKVIYKGFRFGATCPLSFSVMDQLAALFHAPEPGSPGMLGGRGSISRTVLPAFGPVIIKPFLRGGLLGRAVKHTYVGFGKTRSQLEFEQMEAVRKLGVRTPEPLIFASKGRLLYQNWLVTREIPLVTSLAQLSATDPDRLFACLPELGRQVGILLNNRIYHADFHPGNVLIDASGTVYLIDFDKAGPYSGERNTLRLKYRKRWCRAVDKHRLPGKLSETIDTWLR